MSNRITVPTERGLPIPSPWTPAPSPTLTLAGMGALLRRNRLLLALCITVVVLLVAGYTMWVRPVYEATSVLRFEQEQVNLPKLVQQLGTENRVSTEMELLQGRAAAAAVVDSLGLRARLLAPRRARLTELFTTLRVDRSADTATLVIRPTNTSGFTVEQEGAPARGQVERTGDTVRVGGVTLVLSESAETVPEIRLAIGSVEGAIRDFRDALKVSRPAPDADLISIRVSSTDPARAAAAANLMAGNVIVRRQEVQRSRTDSATRYLGGQLDTLGLQLRSAEDSLLAYRQRAGAVDPAEAARTQVGRLAKLEADRGELDAERAALKQVITQMRSDSARATPGTADRARRLIGFPTLFRNQAAAEMLGSLARVESERTELLVRRLPSDPDVQILTDQIRKLDGELIDIAETYLQGLTNQVASLGALANRFSGELDQLPEKEVESARLDRKVQVQQQMYTLVQTRLKEAEITQTMLDPSVRLADPAVAPDKPTRPKPLINLVISILLGSFVGVAAILGRDLADRSVRSRADVMTAAGLPILGVIPRMELPHRRLLARPVARPEGLKFRHAASDGARGNGHGAQGGEDSGVVEVAARLLTRAGVPGAYVEAFNMLHAHISLGYDGRPLKTLVFTSPLPGEGKTLSAINFAMTAAGNGQRVLLIDADLRCGRVGQVLYCPEKPGFSELLAGTAQLAEAAHSVPAPGIGSLMVLPTGGAASGRMLSESRVRDTLSSLSLEFDLIVIDSPPVNVLADAALLAAAADGVVLVVRAGRTQMDAVRFAMDQLDAARARVIGALLNDIDLRRNASDDGSYRYLAEVERYHAVARSVE